MKSLHFASLASNRLVQKHKHPGALIVINPVLLIKVANLVQKGKSSPEHLLQAAWILQCRQAGGGLDPPVSQQREPAPSHAAACPQPCAQVWKQFTAQRRTSAPGKAPGDYFYSQSSISRAGLGSLCPRSRGVPDDLLGHTMQSRAAALLCYP